MTGHCRTALAIGLFASTTALPPLMGQGQPAPSFKAGVDAVRVDVRVVGQDGAFVRGVTKDDLRVFEDGVEQTVTTFSMVELLPAVTTAAPPWPADVATNASFVNGRVYLLVLDDLHIHELRAATVRQLARRFVEQYTTPADRVAVATTSGIGLTSQNFTNNRADLLAAVDQFKPRILPEGVVDDLPQFAGIRAEGPADAPKPTRNTREVLPLQWLLSSVEWLSTIPDRRKAMVFISEGVLDRSTDPDVEGTLREITSAASRANVAIYSVDAHGLPSAPSGAVKPVDVDDDDVFSDRRRRLEAGLATLAEQTGGASVIRSNAFDALFERVVADSGSYYMLGYTSTHSPSRRPRQLEVRTGRPGLTVQSRRVVGPVSAAAAKRAAQPKGLPRPLGDAFQSAVPITDIELSIMTAPRRGSGDRAAVAVVVEGKGTRPLDVFIAAADARGEVQASTRGALKPDGDTRMQATATFQLKPGRYHLRVAAVQPETGTRGSVMHDVNVPDFSKEDLSVGALVLIDTGRGRSPTTRRSFAATESIEVAAEVYWRRGLAEPIAIATRVANDAGQIVYSQEGTVEPAERPSLGVDMGTTIHLERLEPGAYRLAVEAKTTGKRALTARREVPFVVSAR